MFSPGESRLETRKAGAAWPLYGHSQAIGRSLLVHVPPFSLKSCVAYRRNLCQFTIRLGVFVVALRSLGRWLFLRWH